MNPKQSILVIAHDDHLRQTLALILQEAGYMVATSSISNGWAKLLDGWPCDLLIIDTNQPHSKSTKIISEVHRLAPGIRILMLTNYSLSDFSQSDLDEHTFDVLLKPIDPSCIIASVEHLLVQPGSKI